MSVIERAPEQEMLADLAELRRLINEHYIEEARRLAPKLAAKWPDSKEFQRYARVLRPAEILPTPPGVKDRSYDLEIKWLKEHAHEYPGLLLAVYGDRLIATDTDWAQLEAQVREIIGEETAIFHYQPVYWP